MDPAIKAQLEALKRDFAFGAARRELEALAPGELDASDRLWVQQQLALCTYKDEELPLTKRLADAETILEGIGLRSSTTTDAETLTLGGAVYKRRWETAGHLDYLNESLAFYRAAWERGEAEDKKIYAAVNAVYLLEVLASRARGIAERTRTEVPTAAMRAAEAEALRRETLVLAERMQVRDPALTKNYWHQVTLAELHLGQGRLEPQRYALAEAAFRTAASLDPSERELHSAFQQAKALLRCQNIAPPHASESVEALTPPWRAVAALLGDAALLALATHRGKVGLALSGGGFRASLFHLGVLARLAEVDALRSVEVISTVSGGSIVGAHYYLEVQKHLESHPDREISADDYVAIVRRVQTQFLAGVQTNIRVHALGNLVTNLKVAFTRGYTYSRRLGELYERVLYAKVADQKGESERLMTELVIAPAPKPAIGAEPFKPKLSNFRRRAKVPVVLINATSLNSGHNWQFTARSMGEPPGRLNTDVDANARYRRLWYHEAPTPDLERFRLGYAVAASACVPGLFEPIVLEGLYADTVVRLTDGGVHDNQGVAGLLDEGCTLLFVSDASGQMDDLADPPNGRLGVPLRANSILMDRVREAEYEDLENRVDSRALQGLLFVHLKQDLDIEPVTWKQKLGAPAPTLPSTSAIETKTTTRYGIDKDLQRKLAALRTDLDSFTELEAHALMLSGYLMTTHELKRLELAYRDASAPGTWADLDVDAQRLDWPFLALREVMRRPANPADAQRTELARQLDIGSAIVFKAWRLHQGLRVLSYLLGAAALGGLAYLWWQHRTDVITFHDPTVGALSLTLLVFLAILLFPMLRWLRPQKVARDGAVKLALAFVAFLFARLHLLFVEPFFLSAGRLKRLLTLK